MDGVAARSIDKNSLGGALADAHAYGWDLLADLTPAQWRVPYQAGINPPLWELAHVAWFSEWWLLRQAQPLLTPGMNLRAPSRFANADQWLDSSLIAHRARWDLPLPASAAVAAYRDTVIGNARQQLEAAEDSDAGLYLFRLALFHADMHNEALLYMRQALDYSAPACAAATVPRAQNASADAAVPGGSFVAGFTQGTGFSFDNEMATHEYLVKPYSISTGCVSNREFAAFVADAGYAEKRFWSDAGWDWRIRSGLAAPRRWRRDGANESAWLQRWFGAWQALPLEQPVCHVNAYEAEAYCRWAKRRLPGEIEWEYAAVHKLIQWGGSVWEWTADAFLPYAGFAAGPYRDYSLPWFGSHRSLRGGSFATHSRIHHARYRNFYLPERNDIFAGFRTCALNSP